MAISEGYGELLAERMRIKSAPAIVTRVLRKADMAVTEIRCDDPPPGMTGSIQREDGFLVGLMLRDFPNREYWEDVLPLFVPEDSGRPHRARFRSHRVLKR